MAKTIRLERRECEHLLGQFLDESHYDVLVERDTDVYAYTNLTKNNLDDEHNVVAIFRKNFFTKKEQLGAYEGLADAAKPSQNRGLAAGPKGEKLQNRDWVTIEQEHVLNKLSKCEALPSAEDIATWRNQAKTMMDTRGKVWLASEKTKYNFDFERWINGLIHDIYTCDRITVESVREEARRVLGFTSDTTYANPVDSGIAGWFDRYPRIPYGRPTSYTFHNFDRFKLAYPFLQHLSKAFSEFLPVRHAAQYECVQKLDPSFYVPGTVFTTITVNKNFRTAAHRDAGDLHTGFSNLTVVAKDGDYEGGYLIVPELRAAFNIRPGDLLLINNHEYIHGNTPIIPKNGDVENFERISLVCYFREKMLELGEREYEDWRHHFVEARRLNKDHPLWREGWNGVSEDMWDSAEWFEYLRANGGQAMLDKYHPQKEGSSLENLFG
jgi:hypothetical protein